METKLWLVNQNSSVQALLEDQAIREAARLIQENELIAFPTETVYGLGGNAFSDEAITKIYGAKGRPSDNPLIVHIATQDQLAGMVTHQSKTAKALMAAFWPGPLTIIFPTNGTVSKYVTAGLSTVAIRMPNHPVALALIKEANRPIAAPSANLSGKPSPTKADHVFSDLKGRIAGVIDGGQTGVGVESTVVECHDHGVTILRPGGITEAMLAQIVPHVEWDPSIQNENKQPKSPGMKYKHYSPQAPLYIVEGNVSDIQDLVNQKKKEGLSVGVLTTIENQTRYHADFVVACGTREHLETVAHKLYDVLRAFDDSHVNVIFSETFPVEGIGQAIMNRLLKASGGKVIR